jgi:methylenetetrahydrofolate dehydrogenase (NADP+) / methenyltetrahydrofolate cyclohydrolase
LNTAGEFAMVKLNRGETMIILDGRAVAQQRSADLAVRAQAFEKKNARKAHLVVILVGDSGPSQVYVRNKAKACERVGMSAETLRWPAEISAETFVEQVRQVQAKKNVDGILLQLPLPDSLSKIDLGSLLDSAKDADCFTWANVGRQAAGLGHVQACTPQGIMSILSHYKISVEGLNVVVVGRSLIVGRPMSWLLTEAGATVTLCHSRTKNLREFTLRADLVVVAAGKARHWGRADFKKDAVVIDVGIHGAGGEQKICGDVRFEELEGWASAATPVPGGVGPMTIMSLLENTMSLAEARA